MKYIIGRLAAYFFRGLIFLAPLAIIGWVLWSLYTLFADIKIFPEYPWLGPIIAVGGLIVLILLAGMLVSSFLLRPIFASLETLLENTPFIKLIYTSIKDMMEAFVGEKKKFNRPVLITLNNNPEIRRIGFITDDDLDDFGLKDHVAVYVPMSYSFSGNLFIVSINQVEPIKDIPSAEVMKFVVSGGITRTDDD